MYRLDPRRVLNSQVEPLGLLVTRMAKADTDGLSQDEIFRIPLCVNELATNALNHAFKDRNKGTVSIEIIHCETKRLIICIDDDGMPLPARSDPAMGSGMEVSLVQRLLQSVNGKMVRPRPGSKCFELHIQREQGGTEYTFGR